MGWTIPHIAGRTNLRPYSFVADSLDIFQKSARTDSEREALRVLRAPMTPGHPDFSNGYHQYDPGQAAQIRDGLRSLRLGLFTSKDVKTFRDQLADAADKAAKSGRPWEWD
ncbi:hypothetical protein [Streptomyces aidingensis]|uniref:DUF7739 domain-containing protein n=1 Tax=Streptomyces aidingensis TaxID=910347 RepID=A0A1I1PVY2_9ACTN|nr:hypothetical protein [Streptomyces aidingensis]SFD14019.1 hypothetical protein SAMN05421773_11089 [Streptomyces aidingensis]